MNRFIDEKKDNWQRLEDLLGLLGASSLRGLSRVEVREFGELYRRTATDLAIARAETRDPKLINYLNSLVIRAHGKIYRADGEGKSIIGRFFSHDLPRAVRDNWVYVFVAFLTDLVFAAIAFGLVFYDSEFVNVLGLESIQARVESGDRWWLTLNNANQIGSSVIMANNVLVSFKAFAWGAFFGIGTLYILAYNGLFFGGVLAIAYKVDPVFGAELTEFVVGHGVIEMSCIYLAGAAGMMIGYALIDPGDLTRAQALKKKGIEATRIVIGCALILIVAGLIEGFISPSSLPAAVKYGVGLGTGLLMFAYFYFAGRTDAAPENLSELQTP
jgi:uncharacterized membrane protein SpoIIM required for sporulation